MLGTAFFRLRTVCLCSMLLGTSLCSPGAAQARTLRHRLSALAAEERGESWSSSGTGGAANRPENDSLTSESQVAPTPMSTAPFPPGFLEPPPPPGLVEQSAEPEEPRVGQMPNRRSSPTRVIDLDGVTILSNIPGPTLIAPSATHDERDRPSTAPATASTPSATRVPDVYSNDGTGLRSVSNQPTAPVKRSPRAASQQMDNGFSWFWGLFGSAGLLLVPIAALLTRNPRPSAPVQRRRSSRA
jgi:hypothetical protein